MVQESCGLLVKDTRHPCVFHNNHRLVNIYLLGNGARLAFLETLS